MILFDGEPTCISRPLAFLGHIDYDDNYHQQNYLQKTNFQYSKTQINYKSLTQNELKQFSSIANEFSINKMRTNNHNNPNE